MGHEDMASVRLKRVFRENNWPACRTSQRQVLIASVELCLSFWWVPKYPDDFCKQWSSSKAFRIICCHPMVCGCQPARIMVKISAVGKVFAVWFSLPFTSHHRLLYLSWFAAALSLIALSWKISDSVTPSASLVACFCLLLMCEGLVLKRIWPILALRNAEEGSKLLGVAKVCLTRCYFLLPCIQQMLCEKCLFHDECCSLLSFQSHYLTCADLTYGAQLWAQGAITWLTRDRMETGSKL